MYNCFRGIHKIIVEPVNIFLATKYDRIINWGLKTTFFFYMTEVRCKQTVALEEIFCYSRRCSFEREATPMNLLKY